MPLDVSVDGVRYVEGVDITPEQLLHALARGAKVTTSQPPPSSFAAAYERAAAQGAREIVSVHLSGEMSGTVRSARTAATVSPVPVRVVDSRTAALGLGFAALAAARCARTPLDVTRLGDPRVVRDVREGASVRDVRPVAGGTTARGAVADDDGGGDDPASLTSGEGGGRASAGDHGARAAAFGDGVRRWVARAVAGRAHRGTHAEPVWPDADDVAAAALAGAESSRVWFLVDSLEHLRRGGRLGTAAAAIGTVLGLRPILSVQDGRLVVAEKVRTRRAARERLEQLALADLAGRTSARVGVHHVGPSDVAEQVAQRIAAQADVPLPELLVADAGAVLAAHVGPGLLAVVVTDA